MNHRGRPLKMHSHHNIGAGNHVTVRGIGQTTHYSATFVPQRRAVTAHAEPAFLQFIVDLTR
jgi:hypothetical protein